MTVMRSLAIAAALAAISIPAVMAQAPPTAEHPITLYSFGFNPKEISLAAGKPVTLRITNRSGSSHDFTAPAFFAASRIVSGSAASGEIELRGGETKVITLIPAAGIYELHCGHAFHRLFGMRGRITVR